MANYTATLTNAAGTTKNSTNATISAAELGTEYDAIATSIATKADLASPTFTGTVVLPSTTSISTVSATEIAYLDGVTSSIQTQIDAKLAKAGGTMTGDITMSGASIFDANASIAAHATTMDPWSLGNYVTCTGAAVTFTAMTAAPQAGAEVELYMNAAHVFTDGAVFEVDGDANFTAVAGDRVLLRAKSTTVFTVHPRKKDGTSVASTSEAYIYIRDEKASGTAGGAFTSGAWRTRDLNTEVNDAGGHATLASNQITLAAGTYRFKASAPASALVNGHKCRLANITDTIYYYGTSGMTGNDAGVESSVSGRFTIAGSKVFELQHICETTNANTNSMGRSTAGFGVIEVYSQVEFWKE